MVKSKAMRLGGISRYERLYAGRGGRNLFLTPTVSLYPPHRGSTRVIPPFGIGCFSSQPCQYYRINSVQARLASGGMSVREVYRIVVLSFHSLCLSRMTSNVNSSFYTHCAFLLLIHTEADQPPTWVYCTELFCIVWSHLPNYLGLKFGWQN